MHWYIAQLNVWTYLFVFPYLNLDLTVSVCLYQWWRDG